MLADLAEAYGDGTLRLTHRPEPAVPLGADEDVAAELYQRLAAAGLGAAGADTIADVVSCPGAESCRLAVTQSRGLGRAAQRAPEARARTSWTPPSDLDIKISGCPNGCGQHHIAGIGFQGSVRKLGGRACRSTS